MDGGDDGHLDIIDEKQLDLVKMEGEGDDGCQVDIDEFCQPSASKKLKKGDNLDLDEGGPNHGEIDIEDKNPFQVQVILDVVFKMLTFEEVKKFRLVSSTLNQVGFKELSKRDQKPITFYNHKEVELDDKLGALLQLQRRHKKVFPGDHRKLFSNFTFDTTLYGDLYDDTCQQIDQLLKNFPPKYIELSDDGFDFCPVEVLCKFLVKISPTVQEITFTLNGYEYFQDDQKAIEQEVVQKLTSKLFPKLEKISQKFNSDNLEGLFFYSLIGQNSPKLRHLELGYISEKSLGSQEYMKGRLEQAGLMPKLQILGLFDFKDHFDEDLVKVFTEFGQNGILKLRKLQIEQKSCTRVEWIKEIYAPLIASQVETLRILEISIPPLDLGEAQQQVQPRTQFPTLKNLSILQIDYFSTFEPYFVPINFSVQFPKLIEFRTRDIETFLAKKIGHGGPGGSVKSVIILKNPSDKRKKSNFFDKKKLNLDPLYQIFPNLEFFELDVFNFYPIQPFRSQLRKVVIHSELQDLLAFEGKLVQGAKSVEILVDCENRLVDEDSYKGFLSGLLKIYFDDGYYMYKSADYYTQQKYYQNFLDFISDELANLDSVSLTFIGYKISEEFKRDFRAVMPHCTFISAPLKSAHEDEN